jgi:hypothetical protein
MPLRVLAVIHATPPYIGWRPSRQMVARGWTRRVNPRGEPTPEYRQPLGLMPHAPADANTAPMIGLSSK